MPVDEGKSWWYLVHKSMGDNKKRDARGHDSTGHLPRVPAGPDVLHET